MTAFITNDAGSGILGQKDFNEMEEPKIFCSACGNRLKVVITIISGSCVRARIKELHVAPCEMCSSKPQSIRPVLTLRKALTERADPLGIRPMPAMLAQRAKAQAKICRAGS